MKTHVCLLALAVCWGPTFCLAGSDEPADSAAGGASTNRAAFAAVSSRRQAAPSGRPENNWRYRNENGRWWYWSSDNRWSYFNGSRWTPYTGRERGLTPPRALAGQGGAGQDGAVGQEGGVNGEAPLGRAPFGRGMQGGRASGLPTGGVGGQDFGTWFNAYRGFQTGSGALRTAEQGGVEMGTADISAEAPATEVFEFGGIPGRQVRRPSPIGRTMKGSGAWFSSGSPFGIKFGYGSGFGYGGYGFDNPYGYGSRSGGGGAYGYGFGPFGSVGGQTGERLSSLISGGAEPSLIGPEPPGMGAPSRLESAVGGQYGKAGAGVRKLGAGAGGGIGSGSGGAGD